MVTPIMGIYYWHYDLDPDFPVCVLEHASHGNKDQMHWHNYLQIALCVGGRGKYIFTNKEYDIQKGDVFIINNFESHVAISEPDEAVIFLFVIFLPELIVNPGCSQFEFEYLSPFWYDATTFENKIDHATETAMRINTIMYQLRDIWEEQPVGFRHMIDANLKSILGLLIGYYRATDPGNASMNIRANLQLLPALNYIKQHYHENITLKEVSELIPISASRFRHLFIEVTHMRFKEYIAVLRVTEAKKLLLTTELSICDIANEVGYTNINQFYKSFHKHVSMSPHEYRKLFRYSKEEGLSPWILESTQT
jgi:AraC-like DNA-binding protein